MHSQPIMHTHSSIQRFVYTIVQFYWPIWSNYVHCQIALLQTTVKPHLPWLYIPVCKYGCFALLGLISAVHSQICKIYKLCSHTYKWMCKHYLHVYIHNTHKPVPYYCFYYCIIAEVVERIFPCKPIHAKCHPCSDSCSKWYSENCRQPMLQWS